VSERPRTPDVVDTEWVANYVGVSRPTLQRMVNKAQFPEPSRLAGGRVVHWHRQAVEDWVANLHAEYQREECAMMPAIGHGGACTGSAVARPRLSQVVGAVRPAGNDQDGHLCVQAVILAAANDDSENNPIVTMSLQEWLDRMRTCARAAPSSLCCRSKLAEAHKQIADQQWSAKTLLLVAGPE